jgi:hypothetical protein
MMTSTLTATKAVVTGKLEGNKTMTGSEGSKTITLVESTSIPMPPTEQESAARKVGLGVTTVVGLVVVVLILQ